MKVVGHFINGETCTPKGRMQDVYNPATGEAEKLVLLASKATVNDAIVSAQSAFIEWRNTPVSKRARVMFKFKSLLEEHADEIIALIGAEHGKISHDAAGELQRGIENVEFACGAPQLLKGEHSKNVGPSIDSWSEFQPLGVVAGITPFNFPAMVPLWMFPVAIVCGNTFILKPSEKVPLSSIRLGELLSEAGLPPGVFNIVHGDKECVDALLMDPRVAAVSFVGSTAIAKYVYQVGTANGKRVQSAGGAKNHLVIMPDADVSLAVKALAASAYGCAGQRCMAGSVAVAVGKVADPLVEELCSYASGFNVGPTDNNPDSDMGPLINQDAVDRVTKYLDVAASEGATVALDGRRDFAGDGFLVGPSVIDAVEPNMRVAKEEIFGPVLSVMRTGDLETAIAVGDECEYGNGASIFTRDGHAAREFKRRFNAGMIGINVGVPAPMAWLPFTGWNQSFFGDLHVQGTEGIHFYTRQKMTLTRWFESPDDSHLDPVWAAKT